MTASQAPEQGVPFRHQETTTIALVFLLCVVAGWAVTKVNLAYLVLLVPCFAASYLIIRFWRTSVYLILGIVLIEGYFRNLIDSPVVLLVKDGLIALVYLRVFGERIFKGRPLVPATPLSKPLLLFSTIVLLECLNPNVEGVGQALIGIRSWLYYIPLFYVAADMFSSDAQRWRFVWLILVSSIPICFLALYQYAAGPAAYAAQGPAFAASTFVTNTLSGTINIYRPNSTFSWPTHFALFLAFATLMVVACTLNARDRQAKLVAWALLAMLTLVNVMEAQRTTLVLLPLLACVVLALRRTVRVQTLALIICSLAVVLVALLSGTGSLARIQSLFQNEDNILGVRLSTYADEVVRAVQVSAIGLGTGATQIGARYVGNGIPFFVETSFAKVVGDLSVLGLMSYLWLMVTLVVLSKRVHDTAMKIGAVGRANLAAAVLGYQLLVVYAGYELAVVAVTFWLISGAIAGSAMDQSELLTPGFE
jgi:hypothetical protein